MDHNARRLVLLSAICSTACTDPLVVLNTETESTSETSSTTSDASDDAETSGSSSEGADITGDASSSDTGDEPPSPSSNWCDRVVPGPAGDAAIVDLSLAHAYIRFFGAELDYSVVDAALTEVLEPAEALDRLDLTTYDAALASVCIIPAAATAGELEPATLEVIGTTAWIRPGTGNIVLPPETEVVVLDLRDLPNVPELAEVLPAAVAPALATPLQRPTRRMRRHDGHTDQVFTWLNVYGTDTFMQTPEPIEPTGLTDLELVVVTGEQSPPAAAELAGSLRLQERAWLVGHDVFAQVAESSWRPIGAAGAVYRSSDLLEWGMARWPATIHADVITDSPEDVIAAQFPAGSPPSPAYEAGDRSIIEDYDPWPLDYGTELGLGEIRSALVITHGVGELFFPYFDVVGHETDDALLELLAEADPADAGDRTLMHERLDRFSVALHDGSAGGNDPLAPIPTGMIAARIEAVDGYPVVRRTNNPGLQPGDTIIEIDGQPTLAWYAARYPLVSAATDGWRHFRTTHLLTLRDDPIELTIESAQGVMQTLEVAPVDLATNEALGLAQVDRPSGWLDDLGAPSLYYLNIGHGTTDELQAAVDTAIGSQAMGMVVDMRGPPASEPYDIVERLVPGSFDSPWFETPTWSGPDTLTQASAIYTLGGPDAYDGPMVLIVGNRAKGTSENFSIMLVGADRVTVVGQQSAGTNGNVSGIKLPGGFTFTFTGLRVLFPGGAKFHGVGIVPDIEVPFDPAAYALGEDPELLAAIDTLTP